MTPSQQTLTVTLTPHSYPIHIVAGGLENVGAYLAEVLAAHTRLIIVTDDTVAKLYLEQVENSLSQAGFRLGESYILPSGEGSKSQAIFADMLESLLAQNLDRKTVLVALGGGVVGDITGFAASVLLRGLRFIQIPTTLLAQVDSSVGGKTGINSTHGKNLIGTFHQPHMVLIDPNVLQSLPHRHKLAGYAEVVKYGLIRDKRFYDWLDENVNNVFESETDILSNAIYQSCRNKAEVVMGDEREQGDRALLNFGHTLAHGLEAACGYNPDILLHGEAVAIGMRFAALLSVRAGFANPDVLPILDNHWKASGLPANTKGLPTLAQDTLMEAMTRDKKAENGQMKFVLLQNIGTAFLSVPLEESHIAMVLKEFLD